MGNSISYPIERENDIASHSGDEEHLFNEEQVQEETLDLTSLPNKLIYSIIGKLNYLEYGRLEETSRRLSFVINSSNFSPRYPVTLVQVHRKQIKLAFWKHDKKCADRRLHWYMAVIQNGCRIEAGGVELRCRISKARLQRILRLFEKNQTTATILFIRNHVAFDPELLYQFIKMLKAIYMCCEQFIPGDFFIHPQCCFNNLKSLTLTSTGCNDEGLLALKAPRILISSNFISDHGLNKFLEQWKNGEREIELCKIGFGTNFLPRDFDMILDGLDANPIWTPDTHEQSLVAAISLPEYESMSLGNPAYLYSIWRSDCPEEFRVISLRHEFLIVDGAVSEVKTLFDTLYYNQYYIVTQECAVCKKRYCSHHRWYSSQRIKRAFPRAYSAAIRGIRMANTALFTTHCVKFLLGTFPQHYTLPFYDSENIYEEELEDPTSSNNSRMSLTADPPACAVPAAGGTSKHKLTNGGTDKLAFKVKSSNNNEYRIKPVFGLVDPSGSADLEITRLPGAAKEDKLVIQFAVVPADAADGKTAFDAAAATAQTLTIAMSATA